MQIFILLFLIHAYVPTVNFAALQQLIIVKNYAHLANTVQYVIRDKMMIKGVF